MFGWTILDDFEPFQTARGENDLCRRRWVGYVPDPSQGRRNLTKVSQSVCCIKLMAQLRHFRRYSCKCHPGLRWDRIGFRYLAAV